MKKFFWKIYVIAMLAVVSGCSINHPVAKDYNKYLSQHGNEGNLPKTTLESSYSIDKKTEEHRYEFRAATVGYAHLWIVEFGKILDETLKAPYVQTSFGNLQKDDETTNASGNIIAFTLNSYEFKNYRAYVSMNIVLSNNGKEILNKSYRSEGNAKGGQMWGAGPFGMKNATLDSTRTAIDNILSQFIKDLPKN